MKHQIHKEAHPQVNYDAPSNPSYIQPQIVYR